GGFRGHKKTRARTPTFENLASVPFIISITGHLRQQHRIIAYERASGTIVSPFFDKIASVGCYTRPDDSWLRNHVVCEGALMDVRDWRRWLRPGMSVKRWFVLLGFGVILSSLALAMGLA